MLDGRAMFCEYTRPSVVTANCWRIEGDPSIASTGSSKIFYSVGKTNAGFKRCHVINYDFYCDIYNLCTGGDDTGAQIWYSIDAGDSGALTRIPSEKYCHALNTIFTEYYIYWADDTTKYKMHYLFSCSRTPDGIIDYNTVFELADLYVRHTTAYGLV